MLQQCRSRRVLLRRVAGLQGCVQDLEAVDVHRSCRLVGQAPGSARRFATVRRHCEVHLGRAPGTLVVPAGEEELSARGQVVGARNVARVRRQIQGVAVHTHSRGVRGQDSRCWGEPSSLTARRPWGPGSALLWRPPPRRPLRRPESARLFAAPRLPP